MKKCALALLLALISPMLLAAPERVADVLKDLRLHGYTSPPAAVARLQAARDARGGNAPIEQRRRYYAALITLSLPNRNTHLLDEALGHLQRMWKQEHCKPCHAQWLIGKALAQTISRRLTKAQANLQQAAALIEPEDGELQLQLAIAQFRFKRRQGNLNAAVSQTVKARDLAARLGDKATQIQMSINLAVMEAELDYLDQATDTLRVAAEQAQASGFKAALALARLDQGYLHARRNQRPEQLQALQQSLAITQGVSGLAYLEVITRANLADYYLHRDDYPTALKQARQAAKLAAAIHDPNDGAVAVANIGIALAKMGQVDAGVAALRKALELARQSGNLRNEAGVNGVLVNTLKAAGRYKEALQALQAIETVNQKITKQSRNNAVLELQAKYENERKNREIAQLSTQAKLKDAEAAARRWQQGLWTTLAGIALLAVFMMLFRLAYARRANRRLVKDMAKLTVQSSRDLLTGVFNRRHFESVMQAYARDDKARVGLVMVDIDRFKHINDSMGHDAGDEALVEVAKRLQSLVRDRDQVVRWGGEEFVLILPDAEPQSLPIMAQRLLDAFAGTPVATADHRFRVTASVGCIAHPVAPGGAWEQALRIADLAMYQAKQHGRNRAVCVVAVSQPLDGELATGNLAAAERAGAVTTVEVLGPVPTAENPPAGATPPPQSKKPSSGAIAPEQDSA